MSSKVNGTISAKGIDIRTTLSSDNNDYISLTDIAKFKSEDANQTICNWMRLRDSIEFLGIWEQLHNVDFNPIEFEGFKNQSGTNAFLMSPKKWITATNAIGIKSKAGRYGGTYAHSDIAFEFASWLSPEFKLYIIKDYQRLKQSESNHLSLDWTARRELAKTNYRIHTDAIKEHLILPSLTPAQQRQTYATEADVINVALFNQTAAEWRADHADATGNIRDEADIFQLIVLTNLETLNAEFIQQGVPQPDRLKRLRDIAIQQLCSIKQTPSAQRLASKDDRLPSLDP